MHYIDEADIPYKVHCIYNLLICNENERSSCIRTRSTQIYFQYLCNVTNSLTKPCYPVEKCTLQNDI